MIMDTFIDILKLSAGEEHSQEIVTEPASKNDVSLDENKSFEEMIEESTEDLHQILRKELKLDFMV